MVSHKSASVLCAAIAIISPAKLLAQTAPEFGHPGPRKIEIMLPLLYEDRYLGDLAVQLDGDQLSFSADDFLKLVGSTLVEPVRKSIQQQAVDGRLTPDLASSAQVSVTYDRANQVVRIRPSMDARAPVVIGNAANDQTDNLPVVRPSAVAFYANLSGTYENVWVDQTDPNNKGAAPLRGALDLGGRIGGENGIAFITGLDYDESRSNTIVRKETRAYYDIPSKFLRFTLGDLRPRGSGFQSTPPMGGVSIERYFGFEPNYTFRPISRTLFDVTSTSTVEVEVNGIPIRTIRLQPGRYDLQNLPFAQGTNNMQLVIRDDLGNEQVLETRSFFDFDLLAKGVTEFSFAAGKMSSLSNGSITYDGNFAATGFFRKGLSNALTAGVDLQGDTKGGNVGAGVLWASPLGIVRMQGAFSQRQGIGSGTSFEMGYTLSGRLRKNDWEWSVQTTARKQSGNFSGIGDIPNSTGQALIPISWSLESYAQVDNLNWSINAGAGYEKGRGTQADRMSAQVGLTRRLTRNLTLSSLVRYADDGTSKDKGVYLQLRWKIGPNRRIESSYDTATSSALLAYSYQPNERANALAYNFRFRRSGDDDLTNATGFAHYTGNRFEADITHDAYADASLSGGDVQSTRVTLATSLVFAGGRVAVSRPVQSGAFAIIEPHETLDGKKIHVEPSQRGDRAATDFLGPAVVPDLGNFSRTVLPVEVDKLPLGYDLGAGQFILKPAQNAGYRLVVGSDATITIFGQVHNPDGSPVSLVGGKLVPLDKPDAAAIPAFTNRSGRLVATGLQPGKYRLQLNSNPPFVGEINVKPNDGYVLNVGEIKPDSGKVK